MRVTREGEGGGGRAAIAARGAAFHAGGGGGGGAAAPPPPPPKPMLDPGLLVLCLEVGYQFHRALGMIIQVYRS